MAKRILFLAREGHENRLLAHELLSQGLIQAVIFETGEKARRKKMRKLWRDTKGWKFWLLPLDLLFLQRLNRLCEKRLKAKYPNVPHVEPLAVVKDANDPTCVQVVQQFQPDVLLIRGTAILKSRILEIPKMTVNIHGAKLPQYRNVHGDFWALAHHRPADLATTLVVTDLGIDSGPIVGVQEWGFEKMPSLAEARLKGFEVTCTLTSRILKKIHNGELEARPQLDVQAGVWPTPRFSDWLKHRVRLG